MSWFAWNWPWLGAAAAVVALGLLFGTRVRRSPGPGSPWFDVGWLAALGAPVYLLHQVEEHGIDLHGVPYAFRGALCASLGFPDAAACPVPVPFITAVNVGTVWGAAALSVAAGPGRPALALSAYGIPLVNALVHLGDAARHGGAYGAGLLTAAVLLLPASLWALSAGLRTGAIGRGDAAAIALGGVLAHLVLMGSLLAHIAGAFGERALVAVQIANALVPAGVVSARARLAGVVRIRRT
ncbi:HXXEE domain-containing protein [Azospirillum sp. ST 5-10]|uniref:HXXEE domain-containing protein n=1 Tax=unclassified Azospirillum TaxID=2630922 RepID=UPI003F4A640F